MGLCFVGHVKNSRWMHCIDPLPVYPDEYALVASVEVDESVEIEALDKVFELTNTIDRLWWENEKVTLLLKKGTRSTSVGDVVVLSDGSVHRCEVAGWSEITPVPGA